ncbi:Parvulin-like peptidyl-prolyl isomerase [Caldithrix abyssi DSM 13497]|nr:Parvulin-like peptidyl-prolyl isomerase [Caldithrix abyssi DSM 13497]
MIILNNCSREKDSVIKIEHSKIPLTEFENRLNFVPHPNQFLPDSVLKKQLAAALVAERILAMEAVKNKLDTMDRVAKMIHEFEKEAVYERWMEQEIRSKIKISESELKKAYPRFIEKRVVDYLVLSDSTSAALAKQKLKSNSDADELKELNLPLKTKTIEYAETWEPVEEEIYSLKIGEVSNPINVDGKYYVFKLKKVVPHPIFSKHDYNYWKPSIKKRVKARKEMKVFDSVIGNLMRNKKFTIKRDQYEFVLNKLINVIPFRKEHPLQSPEMINMELGNVINDLEKFFDKPFIHFDNGDIWTIGEFWEKLSLGPYLLNYQSADEFKRAFPEVIRKMVIIETVIEEGYKMGLQNTDYVKKQTEMWKANLLAKLYQQSILDTIRISEEDMVKFYEANKDRYQKPELRKILEILVDNRALAERLIKRINAGQDMAALAQKYSIRQIAKKNLEQGFYITRNSWGKIGKIAFSLSPGELFGPLKLDENRYSIIKLIEIKKAGTIPFKEMRERVRTDLLLQKAKQVYTQVLCDRIKQYDIEVNFEALNRIKVLKGNMLVLKSHFPVRSAVPATSYWGITDRWYQQFNHVIWKIENH